MADLKRGRIISNNDLSENNYKGFLPQIVKSKDLLNYFIDNFVNKPYIEENFREDFLVHEKYKVEISYYPVYRLSWDANVRWNTTSSSSERVGDYILTTTTTTKHTRNKSSGTTVFPDDGEWAGKLKVDDFDDDDVCGLGSVNGLDIRWFRIANGLGFDAEPMTQKQLYKKARKTAESEDKGKSVSITWTDLVVLVPIFSVYRVEDNKTIFCMNLYNKTVAIDDVPLVPELDAKLVKYTKLGNLFKWLMVAAFVFGQLLPPIVSGKFGAAFPIIAAILSAIVMIILICCSSSGRLDVRQKLIKNPEGGFVKIQLTLFIMFIIYVALAIGLGMAALVG